MRSWSHRNKGGGGSSLDLFDYRMPVTGRRSVEFGGVQRSPVTGTAKSGGLQPIERLPDYPENNPN